MTVHERPSCRMSPSRSSRDSAARTGCARRGTVLRDPAPRCVPPARCRASGSPRGGCRRAGPSATPALHRSSRSRPPAVAGTRSGWYTVLVYQLFRRRNDAPHDDDHPPRPATHPPRARGRCSRSASPRRPPARSSCRRRRCSSRTCTRTARPSPSAGVLAAAPTVRHGADAHRLGRAHRPVRRAGRHRGRAGPDDPRGRSAPGSPPVTRSCSGWRSWRRGMTSASTNAASGRVVVGWFPKQRRGLAMGIRQMSQPLGVTLAAVTVPQLAEASGIRRGPACCRSSLCAVLAGAVRRRHREPAAAGRADGAGRSRRREPLPVERLPVADPRGVGPARGAAVHAVDLRAGLARRPAAGRRPRPGCSSAASQFVGAIGRILVGGGATGSARGSDRCGSSP